ncbi:hypothetical protein SUDANB176_00236 [Streptomyces sp. enrichment culture]|uniref:hypothetical protein n=1 Tax=Streptomyces sp. enrichment culture TaxID=1795815 RepID=UPI003F546EC2
MYHPDPPSDPPALIEALIVWGRAVEHDGIPLDYAAAVLTDHASCVEHSGVPDPTGFERRTWAAEDLADGGSVVVRMDWPGDDAVDEEPWDQSGDWRMREYLLRRPGLPDSHESTGRLLLRHCDEQIAEHERRMAEPHDEGNRTWPRTPTRAPTRPAATT